MPYIHFTDEQKLQAGSVDLVEFLRHQGEKLIRSGPEYRLSSNHSVTVRGNEWFDHATGQGGSTISFAQTFYGLSYPEAVSLLLGGEQGAALKPAEAKIEEPPRKFALPPANGNMRRVYAYLLQRRFLSREVVSAFAREGLIYESCEKSRDHTKEYHNAVFVGMDEHGIARHAHKRSVNDIGSTFRLNEAGCDPRYSFHYTGTSDRLYVFEAPIDLLSFITRYPKGWQKHSYVALCGTAEHAMLWMLEQNPAIQRVGLCLDHDEAGIEAAGRLEELLREKGESHVQRILPIHKDWNEDLKAAQGLSVKDAEEHPQLAVSGDVCRGIAERIQNTRPEFWEQDLPNLINNYRSGLQCGQAHRFLGCMEQAAALALGLYGRELRQMGKSVLPEELANHLCHRILPHRNRSSWKNRYSELTQQFHALQTKVHAPGVRSKAEKQELADGWLELAVSFAKISVKYEAEEWKKWQERQAVLHQAMTM